MAPRQRPEPIDPRLPVAEKLKELRALLGDDVRLAFEEKRKPRTRRNPAPTRWVPAGEAVEIGGITVPGGMIYVGPGLPAEARMADENCLVNPRLSIAKSDPDTTCVTMGYYPSYTEIRPRARLAYLQWLAGGRSDPEYGVGHVFLFLYGLERRLLVDGAKDEAAAIAVEVRRLLAIYVRSKSLRTYGTRLCDVADMIGGTLRAEPSPSLGSRQLALNVRYVVGRRLARGERVPSREALAWALALPATRRNATIDRAFPELLRLWDVRFSERHPEGLAVAAPDTVLTVPYHAASSTFVRQVGAQHEGRPLPDPQFALDGERSVLSLLGECVEALTPFARALARKSASRDDATVAALLPPGIADTSPGGPIAHVRAEVSELIDAGDGTVRVEALLRVLHVEVAENERVNGGHGKTAGLILDRMGFGFEPDTRYGDGGLVPGGMAVLFPAEAGGGVRPRNPGYVLWRLAGEASGLAVEADGGGREEFAAFLSAVGRADFLEAAERTRVAAIARLAVADGARRRASKGRVGRASRALRQDAAKLVTGSILVKDQIPSAAQVAYLERFHDLLGLADGLYGTLHRNERRDGPAGAKAAPEREHKTRAKRTQSVDSRQVSDPSRGEPRETHPVRIDHERLRRIREETSEVSSMLSAIFEDGITPAPSNGPMAEEAQVAAPAGSVDGLGADHRALLLRVLSAGTMDRAGFEAAARERGLLAEGALEAINEWGFDRFDEAVLEDDGDVRVPEHLADELKMETETE